jgi:hypothetical protein
MSLLPVQVRRRVYRYGMKVIPGLVAFAEAKLDDALLLLR